MRERVGYAVVLVIQVVCAGFFLGQILVTVLGVPLGPVPWIAIELIELGAALGLVIGVVLGALLLRRARKDSAVAEEKLRQAQLAFQDIMEERFGEWGLTPAERDVALFAIKGYATSEIAEMRSVSEGTVKAQTNAIYRKAGVTGRPQLLSLFIDNLIDAEMAPEPPSHSSAA